MESRAATGPSEYQIKAVFVLNLVKHAGWPADALPPDGRPIRVGIVGEDPFGGALEQAFVGVRVAGRPLEVRRWEPGAVAAGEIQLVYVARSALVTWEDLKTGLAGRPVLTVADGDDFCERGGMVNLRVSERGTIRLEVNQGALRSSGMALSSRLLSLPSVRHVGGEGGGR